MNTKQRAKAEFAWKQMAEQKRLSAAAAVTRVTAKQRWNMIKTLPNVYEKAIELTGGAYFEQPVDPPERHF